MFYEVITGTDIIFYLMIVVGAIGGIAKVINLFTLHRIARAAGNMSKSTHRLIRLVRAKYEHACMLHDRVENAEAFVEKYIYEYRGLIFRIHTWRQIEIQSIWFAGILAAMGAIGNYFAFGFCERVYQFAAVGTAEMVLLFVISQISDEQYRMEAVKNYMVDYLENVCAYKYRKLRRNEREQKARIDVIQPDGMTARNEGQASVKESADAGRVNELAYESGKISDYAAENSDSPGRAKDVGRKGIKARGSKVQETRISRKKSQESKWKDSRQKGGVSEEFLQAEQDQEERFQEEGYRENVSYMDEKEAALSINIEGEPRNAEQEESGKRLMERRVNRDEGEEEQPILKEEAIRQILEEFLA